MASDGSQRQWIQVSSAVPLPGPGWVLVEESLYFEPAGVPRTTWLCNLPGRNVWSELISGSVEEGREAGNRVDLKKSSIEPLEHLCVPLSTSQRNNLF